MRTKPGYLFKSKSTLTRDELADLLQNLAERIRTGEVTLASGVTETSFTAPPLCRTEVELRDKFKRNRIERKLEVEVEWYVDPQGNPTGVVKSAGGIAIS